MHRQAQMAVKSKLGAESSVFFFQAEDGIRDYKVTGVQTCALPILYLPDPIAQKAHQIFQPLEKTLNLAKNPGRDRKSTRLNSSHLVISYAVFCLKKKKGESQKICKKQTNNSRLHVTESTIKPHDTQ